MNFLSLLLPFFYTSLLIEPWFKHTCIWGLFLFHIIYRPYYLFCLDRIQYEHQRYTMSSAQHEGHIIFFLNIHRKLSFSVEFHVYSINHEMLSSITPPQIQISGEKKAMPPANKTPSSFCEHRLFSSNQMASRRHISLYPLSSVISTVAMTMVHHELIIMSFH